MSTNDIVVQGLWGYKTLSELKAHFTEGNTHQNYKSSQEPVAGKFTGTKGKPVTPILLNGYRIELPSKFVYLYM